MVGLGRSSCGKQAASLSQTAAKAAMPAHQEQSAKLCAQPAAAGVAPVRIYVPGTGGKSVVTAEVKSCSRRLRTGEGLYMNLLIKHGH